VLKPNQYVTFSGIQQYNADMTAQMKVVARWSSMFERALPLDFIAFENLVLAECPPKPGAPINGEMFSSFFFAHAMKWPPLVSRWSEFRRQERCESDGGVAANLLGAVRRCVHWAHSKTLETMHAGMTFNRMHATTGPAAACRELGILKNKPDTSSGAEQTVNIGVAGKKYFLTESASEAQLNYVQYVIDAADRAQLRWPSADSEVEQFATDVLGLVKLCQQHDGKCGLSGGKKDGDQYLVKHATRMFLLILDRTHSNPCTLDGLTWEKLRRWCPDKQDHLQQFSKQTGAEIRARFGCSAPLVACWLCFLHGTVSEEQLGRLATMGEANLWKFAFRWEKELTDTNGS
jgi:hypothetical protein